MKRSRWSKASRILYALCALSLCALLGVAIGAWADGMTEAKSIAMGIALFLAIEGLIFGSVTAAIDILGKDLNPPKTEQKIQKVSKQCEKTARKGRKR